MKTIKFNRSQNERYRQNRYALIDSETGEFKRYASEQEARDFAAHAAKRRTIRVRENGKLLNFKPDRERLKEELLAEHKENVRVVRPNGVQVMVARFFVPSPKKGAQEPTRTAPHPSRCQCSEWEGRPDGKHHPQCPMNEIAPDEHRVLPDITLGEPGPPHFSEPEVPDLKESAEPEELPYEVEDEPPALGTDVPPPESPPETEEDDTIPPPPAELETSEEPPSPGDCECLKWKRPPGSTKDGHHPTCPHDGPWREHQEGALPYFLWTINGVKMRRATPEERVESQKRLREVGTPTIVISDMEFMVLNEAP